MDKNLTKLEPQALWGYFQGMCSVPRPSKYEEKIRDWLVEQIKELKLDYRISEIGNLIIQKTATPGMENRKIVTMQAHMDMVPAKLIDKEHDFKTDSIVAYIDGDWVTADGTTLGADNGIGVATGLAILAAKDIPHGPLEMLITVDEEAGMTGAFGLKHNDIRGDILLNLDSEDDREVCIGCAGGVNTDIELPISYVNCDNSQKSAYKITLSHLVSGHSGVDIHLGRANAIKEIANLLYYLKPKVDFQLAHISGGKLRNVIPSYCEVIIVIDSQQYASLQQAINDFDEGFKIEYANIETKYKLTLDKCELPAKVITPEISHKFLLALKSCFNGLYRMNWDLHIPQVSSNIGKVHIENDCIKIISLQRSPDKHTKATMAEMVAASFELIGARINHEDDYPGWLPDTSSEMLQVVRNSYRQLFNQEIKVSATHGGLECGLILAKYPQMDAVSIGATICDPHSANERVNIKSVHKVWGLVKTVLQNVPVQAIPVRTI